MPVVRQVNFFVKDYPYTLHIPVVLSLLGYLIFLFAFPLLPYFDVVPQVDIRSFTPSLLDGLLYGALLVGLFVLYGLGFRALRQRGGGISLPGLLSAVGAVAVLLLFTYPINATDVYRYVIRGRIMAVYGESQYQLPPAAFPNDPFTPLAGEWSEATSPYGPLWELTAAAVTSVTQDNLLAGLLAFKLIGLLSHLGITALIGKMHPQQGAAAWLWGANPALLLIFVVNAHNDGLMLFWLVLAVYLVRSGGFYQGMAVALFAPLTKPIGLLALPFVGLLVWHRQTAWVERLLVALVALLLGIALLIAFFAPFGSTMLLVERLGNELNTGMSFSPFTLLVFVAHAVDVEVPFSALSAVGQLGFGAVTLWLLWVTQHGRSPFKAITDIFAAFLLQAFNFRIWYASWLLPWALLDGELETTRVKAAVFFLITTQLSVLIYGHLRVYAFGGSQLLAHLVGVPFTFFLPLLLAKLDWGLGD